MVHVLSWLKSIDLKLFYLAYKVYFIKLTTYAYILHLMMILFPNSASIRVNILSYLHATLYMTSSGKTRPMISSLTFCHNEHLQKTLFSLSVQFKNNLQAKKSHLEWFGWGHQGLLGTIPSKYFEQAL